MVGSEHFFVVGMQRCGTTYAAELLADHPHISFARPLWPEPKFFLDDELYAKGVSYYLREYVPGAGIRGSKATSYAESSKALDRIARDLPDAKLIVILRDPVDRAVSNYNFSVQNGLEEEEMEAALTCESMQLRPHYSKLLSASPFAYLWRGLYAEHLERVWSSFPPDQVGIFFFEELVDSQEAVASIYRFLGADDEFRSASAPKVINSSDKQRTETPPSVLESLARYFSEPNERLARQLGRPLPGWRTPSGNSLY